MGYGNPLHGLDSNGERTSSEDKVMPPTIELDSQQAQRMLALQLARNVLEGTGPTPGKVLELAQWIIGDVDADYPVKTLDMPTSAEDFMTYEKPFKDKVEKRQDVLSQAFSKVFERARLVDESAWAEEVPSDSVKIGDVICTDGDVIVSEPEFDGKGWSALANCPITGLKFTFSWPPDSLVRVFSRA
jgi:hypothetical protein